MSERQMPSDDGGACHDCGAPGTVKFTEAFRQFFTDWFWLCQRCYVHRQIVHALEAAERLPGLFEQMATLVSGPPPGGEVGE
jgi:hypothetical protein